MKLSFDLHIHTELSYDAHDPVEKIVERAREIGLDGIAITDHDTVDGVKRAEEISDGLLVIPGVEVSTIAGHLIVLGIHEIVPSKLSLRETIELAHSKGGIVIVPHPFHPFRHPVGNFTHLDVDAVEIFNSRYLIGISNRKAEKVAARAGLSFVAGSDAHTAEMIGYGITEIETRDASLREILDGIINGRTSLRVAKTPISLYLNQVARGFIKKWT
jgi:hypothetical protein